MIETRTKEIDGFNYAVVQLGATKGRKLLTRLVKLAGPALGNLVKGAEAKDGEADVTAGAIGDAIATFASSISESEIEALFAELLPTSTVEIDGASHNLKSIAEIHFAGRYGAMLKWLGFALEVNYGGFFDASKLTEIGRRAFEAKSTPSGSTPSSTGMPTA